MTIIGLKVSGYAGIGVSYLSIGALLNDVQFASLMSAVVGLASAYFNRRAHTEIRRSEQRQRDIARKAGMVRERAPEPPPGPDSSPHA